MFVNPMNVGSSGYSSFTSRRLFLVIPAAEATGFQIMRKLAAALATISLFAGVPTIAQAIDFTGTGSFSNAGPTASLLVETGRSDYIYFGAGVDPVPYIPLYSSLGPPAPGGYQSVVGHTFNQTGTPYGIVSASVRGAGTYSFSITAPNPLANDLMSALYVANGTANPFNSGAVGQNLIATNDDSNGNGSASNPYKLYYINTDPTACVTMSLVFFDFNGDSGVANFDVSGPGQVAANCNSFAPLSANTLEVLSANARSVDALARFHTAELLPAVDYDCKVFDRNNFCISFGGSYLSAGNSQSDGSGTLIAAYRFADRWRIGGFLDYRAPDVHLGNVSASQSMPFVGTFLAFDQNRDGTAIKAKVYGGYHQGRMTATRDDTLLGTEPGSGTSRVSSYIIGAEAGYGLKLWPATLVTPFLAVRHTDVTDHSYTEGASALVTYPISYDPFSLSSTTGTVGARVEHFATHRIKLTASAAAEYDLYSRLSSYSGTSAIPGLESFSIALTDKPNRLHAAGSVGASYLIAPSQQIDCNVAIRGVAYSSTPAIIASASYTIGF